MSAPGASRRLTSGELDLIRKVLTASGDENEADTWSALGRRTLTDDEREHVRALLLIEALSYGFEADGSMTREGRAVDDIIGKLMFY